MNAMKKVTREQYGRFIRGLNCDEHEEVVTETTGLVPGNLSAMQTVRKSDQVVVAQAVYWTGLKPHYSIRED